ncbi:hypothetical protein [Marinomonas sp. 2405UD68-3]|uniref:hypothetical protein n=1 Tax=Marinomonas sp. 2405UD68-3 TaxID=3391835 RepID=UPI0039C90DB2
MKKVIVSLLMLVSGALSAKDFDESGLGKALQFTQDGFGAVGQILLILCFVGGVGLVIGILVAKATGKDREGALKVITIGIVLIAIGAGGLPALINDSGITEGADGFEKIDFYSESNN